MLEGKTCSLRRAFTKNPHASCLMKQWHMNVPLLHNVLAQMCHSFLPLSATLLSGSKWISPPPYLNLNN